MSAPTERDVAYAIGYAQCYIDAWGADSEPDEWISIRNEWDINITRDENAHLVINAYPVIDGNTDTTKPIHLWIEGEDQ